MKILITGSSGYIGSGLSQFLKQMGVDLVTINREKGIDMSRIGWVKKLKVKNIHTIIHLAQSRNYWDFENKSQEIFAVNVSATNEILNWAKKNKVKRFFFASTFNVYDCYQNGVLNEKSAINPISFYGISKSLSEKLVSHYSTFFETIIFRFNTVYGLGQKNNLFPNMIKKLIDKEKFFYAKNIGLLLSPIYLDDLTYIIYKFIICNERFQNEIFNISSDEIISLKEIVNKISQHFNINQNYTITDENVMNFSSDPSKLLNFIDDDFSFVSINEGIKKICDEISV